MVAAGAALTLANAFSAASSGVSAFLYIIMEIGTTIKTKWDALVLDVKDKWPDILTDEWNTGEDGWIKDITNWIEGISWHDKPDIITLYLIQICN